MNNCKQIGVQQVSELPIDNLESTPDYFIAIREFVNDQTGQVDEAFTRVPGQRLLPSGNLDNVFGLEANNDSLAIPENQVLPVYVANEATQNVVYPAGANHPAMFLAFGTYGVGQILGQSTGVLNITAGTDYIVGAQYYLASDGGVTTSASQTGQKLFIPISKTKLLINM